jgi:uncharacterized membrane protein YphA (DoxX/SURF4 family)
LSVDLEPPAARWSRLQPWLSLAVRLGLAAVTLLAAIPKLRDLRGSGLSVGLYRIFPTQINQFIGVALPIIELTLAVLFLTGLLSRYASVVFGLMLVAFIAGIISAWARGLNINCGCFAIGTELAAGEQAKYGVEILRDAGFLAMTAFLAIWPRSVASLDNLFGLNPGGGLAAELIDIGELDEDEDDGEDDGDSGDGQEGGEDVSGGGDQTAGDSDETAGPDAGAER